MSEYLYSMEEVMKNMPKYDDAISIVGLLYKYAYDETKTDKQKIDLIKSYTVGFIKKYYPNSKDILEKWKT